MQKINPRPMPNDADFTDFEIPLRGPTTYRPLKLTAKYVFDNAYKQTQDEMARHWCISRDTLMAKLGDYYHAGKEHHKLTRRNELEMFIDQIKPSHDYNHGFKDAKSNEYLKAMELWFKRYDGLLKETADTSVQAEAPKWVVEAPTFTKSTELSASEKAELEGEEE